jgi:serine/threonine-protein kinase
MRAVAPLLTLVAGAGLAGLLIAANLTLAPGADDAAAVAAAPAAPVATPAADAAPSPATATTSAEPTAPPSATTPPPGPARVSTGSVDGTDLGIALHVVDGGPAVAYVCDGDDVEVWLTGTAEGGTLELTGSSGMRVSGTYTDGGATGVLTASGYRWTFTTVTGEWPAWAPPVPVPSPSDGSRQGWTS